MVCFFFGGGANPKKSNNKNPLSSSLMSQVFDDWRQHLVVCAYLLPTDIILLAHHRHNPSATLRNESRISFPIGYHSIKGIRWRHGFY